MQRIGRPPTSEGYGRGLPRVRGHPAAAAAASGVPADRRRPPRRGRRPDGVAAGVPAVAAGQPGRQPDAYVCRMVVNAFVDGKRRRSSTEAPTAPSELPATAQLDHSDQQAERSVMWTALAGLPRVQRAVLVLRFYEDLDDARIAELMGSTPSTVRSNASRALATLRKEWTRV
nr:sigma-70 family RNA polymerase sigma factor [Jiangella alkaliphila]